MPNANYAGADTFAYRASDGTTTSNIATVTINVNRSPVANKDSAATKIATAVIINVLANDSDPDGDQLTITGTTKPKNGTVSIVNGAITYTPSRNYTGTDSFNYTISDGRGGTATTTVSVVVGK
jgi:hypothetical protein